MATIVKSTVPSSFVCSIVRIILLRHKTFGQICKRAALVIGGSIIVYIVASVMLVQIVVQLEKEREDARTPS